MKMEPPKVFSISQILPPELPLLMGAGPVPIPSEVARANMLVINHLGEAMNQVVHHIKNMGRYVFQTQSENIFGISGPGSAAMEMGLSSVLWPGRKILVLNLGTFSNRLVQIAQGVGAEVFQIFPKELSVFSAEEVELVLKNNSIDVVALVHGETSCGMKNIHLEKICQIAKSYGAITIVDTVCTLSTMPFQMDDWGIDIAFTGGQKGLSSVAGVSLIAFSDHVFKFIQNRSSPMPHWCLDPLRAHQFWIKNEYHYTAPVNGLLAFHEALRLVCTETLPQRFERHTYFSQTLQDCLGVMGFEFFAPKECRLNSVLAVKNKNQLPVKEVLSFMKKEYLVELSGAFGLDIFRIGQMGEQARAIHVRRTLQAIAGSYEHFGVHLNTKEAFELMERRLTGFDLMKISA